MSNSRFRDIQDAADALLPVYKDSNFHDGYVSLEVSPYLARETAGTWKRRGDCRRRCSRPNVMIKVPGTAEGLPAIQQLIGEGININVTLLFSQEVYVKVAEAYVAGPGRSGKQRRQFKKMASVASFFISRIDSAIEKIAEGRSRLPKTRNRRSYFESLKGKVAIANGKLAYQSYLHIFAEPTAGKTGAKGAQAQRVLWASTSTKNPKYRDVHLRRGIDRQGHGQHGSAGYARGFSRPRNLRESLTEDVEGAKKIMATQPSWVSLLRRLPTS